MTDQRKVTVTAPDYSKPGVAEQVEREQQEWEARWSSSPYSSMMETYYMFLTNQRRRQC